MRIGHHQLRNRLIAAPMAGITDRPFRTLCYEMGAGLTVSEMMSSNPQVWESDKSRLRMVHIDEPGIRTVQIAGSVPEEMADAARINVESGAQIIDINMGCPAKKGESQACRFSPSAIPRPGEVNPDGGCQRSGRSCYVEDSHGLVAGTP